MAEQPPQQRLRPKRYTLGIGGLSLFGTGSCLLWTVILAPISLVLMPIGMLMMIAVPFIKTEPMTCPACGTIDKVEPTVHVLVCPKCHVAVKRGDAGWVRV